jgi:hypothetical protein
VSEPANRTEADRQEREREVGEVDHAEPVNLLLSAWVQAAGALSVHSRILQAVHVADFEAAPDRPRQRRCARRATVSLTRDESRGRLAVGRRRA